MKNLIIQFILALSAVSAFPGGIHWQSSYDQALEKSDKSDKNILVLITAPSWCTYCVWMEENTFSDKRVISAIKENFIPLRLLDVVDGEANTELSRFTFSGYPTMFVYKSDGEPIAKVPGAVGPDEFLSFLDEYRDPDFSFSTPDRRIAFDKGEFRQLNLEKWEETSDGPVYTLMEVQRDRNVYLWDQSRKIHIALPLDPAEENIMYTEDRGETWKIYGRILKK